MGSSHCTLVLLVALVLMVPEIQLACGVVFGVLVCCGGAMWLTRLGRGSGKTLEPTPFKAWGGKPSAAMLRHRDSRISQATKERYRAILERRVPMLELASQEDEERSLTDADDG